MLLFFNERKIRHHTIYWHFELSIRQEGIMDKFLWKSFKIIVLSITSLAFLKGPVQPHSHCYSVEAKGKEVMGYSQTMNDQELWHFLVVLQVKKESLTK